MARLRAFWVLARQSRAWPAGIPVHVAPAGGETGVWVLGLHVALALPTGGLLGRVPAARARSGAGNAEIVSQEEEGTRVAASGPGTLRKKVVRRGTGGWAGGLATWSGKSLDGDRGRVHGQAGRKLRALYEGKGGDEGAGREERVLETREP